MATPNNMVPCKVVDPLDDSQSDCNTMHITYGLESETRNLEFSKFGIKIYDRVYGVK